MTHLRRAAAVTSTVLVAVLVTAVLGLRVAQWTGHAKVLSVTGGSMAPAIPYGSLVITTPAPARTVAVGQVVSVVEDGVRFTHRVVAIGSQGLTTRGDANPSADAHAYTGESVDLVRVSVPLVGRVLTALNGTGRVLLAAALLLLVAARWPQRRTRTARHSAKEAGDQLAGQATLGARP